MGPCRHLPQLSYDCGGDTGREDTRRDVAADNGAGRDHGVAADPDTRQDHHVGPDPDPVADRDRLGPVAVPMAGGLTHRLEDMRLVMNRHALAETDLIADVEPGHRDEVAPAVDEDTVAERNGTGEEAVEVGLITTPSPKYVWPRPAKNRETRPPRIGLWPPMRPRLVRWRTMPRSLARAARCATASPRCSGPSTISPHTVAPSTEQGLRFRAVEPVDRHEDSFTGWP